MNPVKNQKLGARFENAVADAFAADSEHFLMEKVTPPARIYGRKVIFMANPFLDFAGAVRYGTSLYPLYVECKATTGGTLRIGNGGLSVKQCQSMHRWYEFGCIVVLLWLRVGVGVRALGPTLIESIMGDRKHLKHETDGYRVPVKDEKLDMMRAIAGVLSQ